MAIESNNRTVVKPSLYLIPTPIGNLEDITLRALRVMKEELDVLLAEDTRNTSVLLKHYGISVPELRSYHMHNEKSSVDKIIQDMHSGCCFGLVTDAGTPAISDPGEILVRACVKANLKVESLPGPSAVVTALVASGLPTESFLFDGFLPQKKGRLNKITDILERDTTTVLYESPNRLQKLLQQICALGECNRSMVVARELSKLYETYHRGTAQELLSFFDAEAPRGELIVLIAPKIKEKKIHKNKYKG